MLDQNTDRMWYVIGAVIIGAAIILIMNKTFPQLFASVGDTFKSKTDQTTDVINGMSSVTNDTYIISRSDVSLFNATEVNYDQISGIWTINVKPAYQWLGTTAWSSGFKSNYDKIVVPYGQSLTISYEVFVQESVQGMYAYNDINVKSVDTTIPNWNALDNDNVIMRKHNGISGANTHSVKLPIMSGQWTKIEFSYSNTDSKNISKVALADGSQFGLYTNSDTAVTAKFRNIKAVLGKE